MAYDQELNINYGINNADQENEKESAPAQQIGRLATFVLSINFIIGAGVFSMPFAFYHAGILYGAGVLIVVTCSLIITSNYTLEVCSRAQALETVIAESDIPDLTFQDVSIIGKRTGHGERKNLLPTPKYQIKGDRKFEFTELMEIFFGLPGRILTASSIIIFLWVTLLAYGSIFASTWAMTLPWNVSVQTHNRTHMVFGHCALSQFDKLLPEGYCLNTYRFCNLIYALIVLPMCMMNLASMKPIQLALSFLMQLSMVSAVIHCIYGIAVGNVAGNEAGPHPPRIVDFDFKAFLTMVPIVLYGQVLHEGIPLIAQPSKDKKGLHKLFALALSYSGVQYMLFAVLTALRFREDTAPMATLNWTTTSLAGNPLLVRLISYMILMIPSIVVCSAFPMCAITMVSNLFILITGKDASNDPSWKFKFKVLVVSLSVPPLIGALFLCNLKTIAKYAGLIAFFMTMICPIMLQVQSRKKCRRVFGQVDQWIEESIAASVSLQDSERRPLLDKYAKIRDVMTMTPYYSSWWSRTTVVIVVSVVCGVLFVFGLTSAFVTPSTH